MLNIIYEDRSNLPTKFSVNMCLVAAMFAVNVYCYARV